MFKLGEPSRRRSVLKEIKILSKLSHPYIVRLYESIQTETNVYLIFEFVSGLSLYQYIKTKPMRRINFEEAKKMIK